MNEHESSDATARALFLERLPWYLNGTLPADEHAWVERTLRESPWAAGPLAREQTLVQATEAGLAPARDDIGLARLLARVRDTPAPARTRAGPAMWLQKLSQFLSQPQFALAAVLVLTMQSALIGWLVAEPGTATDDYRGIGITEVRTLRVTFAPDATEARIRAALLAAGARVVGGPNQLGEYWIASSMKSLDEVKAALLLTGLTMSIEVDAAGPRGQ